MEKTKWYQHKGTYLAITIVTTLFLAMQNYYQGRDNDRLRVEQTEINHRLDVRDAYFNKGLIDGAKDREKAYFEMRTKYEQILAHCLNNKCNLPTDLAILPTVRQFDSLEAMLSRK